MSLYQKVCRDWLEFCSCDQQHKETFSATLYGECGYNKVGKEAVALSEAGKEEEEEGSCPDPVESLENGYSDSLTGNFPRSENGYRHGDRLRDSYRDLYRRLDSEVIRPCLDIASRALQLEQGSDLCSVWFREGCGAYQLRLAHYVLTAGERRSRLLYGEHTDYDGLTFLWRNRFNGLQAWLGGRWEDIPLLETDPHALLINLGDLMEFWTGSTWHSPLHRVVRSTAGGSPCQLVSVVMFAGPHPNTSLTPLASPLLPPSTTQEEDKLITAGQHVRAKIGRTATLL